LVPAWTHVACSFWLGSSPCVSQPSPSLALLPPLLLPLLLLLPPLLPPQLLRLPPLMMLRALPLMLLRAIMTVRRPWQHVFRGRCCGWEQRQERVVVQATRVLGRPAQGA
jgi:hypothetical protein